MSDDYEIGYGKPPKEHQFPPGQSGNKKGRPKEAKSLKNELEEELHEKIPIKEGGKQKSVSKLRAMLKAQMAKAVQGDTKAANIVINMTLKLLTDEVETPEEIDLSATDLAILEEYASTILSKSKKKEKSNAK
jgi:hypothetical protein